MPLSKFNPDSEVVKINLPFPERIHFMNELKSDMQDHYDRLISEGRSPRDAVDEVSKSFKLTQADITALGQAYQTPMQVFISRIPSHVRSSLFEVFRFIVAFAFIITLVKEVPMIQFLNEGGVIIYAILVIGGGVVLTQLFRYFKWFIYRDHSDDSLDRNTTMPVIAAALIAFVGILGSAVGYYVVFTKWANQTINETEFKIGLYEPLPCIIVAMLLGAIILTIHLITQSKLRSIGVYAFRRNGTMV